MAGHSTRHARSWQASSKRSFRKSEYLNPKSESILKFKLLNIKTLDSRLRGNDSKVSSFDIRIYIMLNTYSKHILKNGIRLILVPDESKEVVTTMIAFGVGSRYESDTLAGISHVLEHMHYKGTKKRPTALAISEFIEGVGGEHNAFTSKEYTGYFVKVASKYLERSVDFLADLLTGSLFDPAELEKEKDVIVQELDMYEDLPMEVAASRFETALFGKNSLGRDVIGYKKSVKSITRDDLIKYRDQYYLGVNTVVVLSGNFGGLTEKEAVALIGKCFNLSERAAPKYPKIKLNHTKSYNLVHRKNEQSQLVIGFPGCSHTDPDRYNLKMLALILGGSMSSRMFTEIREKRGLAYAVRSSVTNYLDTGSIETVAGVPHARVEETIKAILAEYEKIILGVTATELNRAKEYIYGSLLIGFEDSTELASHYLLNELLTSQIKTPAEVAAVYQKITLADVKKVAAKYLDFSRLTISFVGPELTEEKLKQIIN